MGGAYLEISKQVMLPSQDRTFNLEGGDVSISHNPKTSSLKQVRKGQDGFTHSLIYFATHRRPVALPDEMHLIPNRRSRGLQVVQNVQLEPCPVAGGRVIHPALITRFCNELDAFDMAEVLSFDGLCSKTSSASYQRQSKGLDN